MFYMMNALESGVPQNMAGTDETNKEQYGMGIDHSQPSSFPSQHCCRRIPRQAE